MILALATLSVTGILMSLIYLVIVLGVIWFVLWFVERIFGPVPQPVRVVLGCVVLLLVLLWACRLLGIA